MDFKYLEAEEECFRNGQKFYCSKCDHQGYLNIKYKRQDWTLAIAAVTYNAKEAVVLMERLEGRCKRCGYLVTTFKVGK